MKIRWRKSALSVIGIAIGVCAVVLINAMGTIGTKAVSAELEGLGLGGILVSHADSSIPMSNDEVHFLKKTAEVAYVMPLSAAIAAYNIEGSGFGSAAVFGVDEGVGNIISLQIQQGRILLPHDLREKKTNCIIDAQLANRLSDKGKAVGEKLKLNINGNMVEFTVIGIAESGTGLLQNMAGAYMPSFVYVPYTTLQYYCGFSSNQQIVVQLNDLKNENAGDRVKFLLEQYTGKKDVYQVQSLAQQQESLQGLLGIITTVLTLIGGISLLVACLNIMTTMLVAVRERTREIGIKKAIGASSATLLKEFILEAAVITASGSILGIVGGNTVVYVFAVVSGITVSMPWKICVTAFTASVLCGTVFGVYPAYRAAHLDPIEALKFE